MYDRLRDLLIGEGGPPAWDESNRTGKGTWTPQRLRGTTAAQGMTPAEVDAAEAKSKIASSNATKARLEFRKKKAKKP